MNRSAGVPESTAHAAAFAEHAAGAIARCASRGCRVAILCVERALP